MVDEVTQKEEKPLLPRTAAGATIVAIPLATLLGGMGWVGQKVLLIDELQVQLQQTVQTVAARQEKHETQIVSMQNNLIANTKELETRGERFERSLRDLVAIDERVIRNDTFIQDCREEQMRLRDKVDTLAMFDVSYNNERLSVIEHYLWRTPEDEK